MPCRWSWRNLRCLRDVSPPSNPPPSLFASLVSLDPELNGWKWAIICALLLALALVVVSRKRRRVDVDEAFLGEGKGEALEPKVVLHESNVGLVTRTWAALLEQQVQRSGTGHEPGSFPVEALLNAMTVQTSSSRVLGGFMILVCKSRGNVCFSFSTSSRCGFN